MLRAFRIGWQFFNSNAREKSERYAALARSAVTHVLRDMGREAEDMPLIQVTSLVRAISHFAVHTSH